MEKKLDQQQKTEIAELKARNQQLHESLRRKDAVHRAELEKRRRLEWRAQQQKLEELEGAKRSATAKDKELGILNERLLSKQRECDKLEDEVKRMKNAESWKASSPCSSTDDLSTPITKRERDMAMRNSELSYRIRQLEDTIGTLREKRKSLEEERDAIRGEIAPLKVQNEKSKSRCNELNDTVRKREKKVNQLSQELLNTKTKYQQTQEENGKQQKSIQQLNHRLSEYRTQEQKLILKNQKLREAYEKLGQRVKELEYSNNELQEQARCFSLPTSPIPTSLEEDRLSVSSSSSQLLEQRDQLEFERDEMQAKYDEVGSKYEEMKNEYRDIREKYKALYRSHHQLQSSHDDALLQVQKKSMLDQLSLEREVMLLRSSKEENVIDQERHEYVLLAMDAKLKDKNDRIEGLENFIVEQDSLMSRKEQKWKEEYNKLFDILKELRAQILAIHIVKSECSDSKSDPKMVSEDTGQKYATINFPMEQEVPNEQAKHSPETAEVSEDTLTQVDESPDGVILFKKEITHPRDGADLISTSLPLEPTSKKNIPERNDLAEGIRESLELEEECTDDHAGVINLEQQHYSNDPVANTQEHSDDQIAKSSIESSHSPPLIECESPIHDTATKPITDAFVEHAELIHELEDCVKSLKGQLAKKENEIKKLRRLLSEAKVRRFELQDSLQELDKKLSEQEEISSLQVQEKDDAIHELNSKVRHLNNKVIRLKKRDDQEPEYDRDEALKSAHEIGDALNQVEDSSSSASVAEKLHILREILRNFLQTILKKDLLQPRNDYPVAGKGSHFTRQLSTQEYLESAREQYASDSEESSVPAHVLQPEGTSCDVTNLEDFARVFVVVMDYDPQSLCITGQPELELHLQAGSVITVTGGMDDDGYYIASCGDKTGMVPANFIQEIELRDKELITRLTNKTILLPSLKKKDSSSSWFDTQYPEVSDISHSVEISYNMSTSSSQETATAIPEAKAPDDVTCQKKGEGTSDSGHYKTYIALYDYDPLASSSSANPEFELSFREGSLLKIFGEELSDGYLVGELNGRRGLIPANFVLDTSQNLEKPPTSSIVTSKVMVALYDYKPERDSPNPYHDMELEFNVGDLITVYGCMHSDGFYSGQLKGKFGLVPSNFVQEDTKTRV